MKTIKGIILLGMALFLFVNANTGKNKGLNSKGVALVLTATVDSVGHFYSDTIPISFITANLYNPTRDTIWFETMSCSYEAFFITNSNKFKIQRTSLCQKNICTSVALPPKSHTGRWLAVGPINKNIELKNSKIKIGMQFFTPEEFSKRTSVLHDTSILFDTSEVNVIWSNEIDLGKFR